ncbi:rnhA [Wigglesworthia glossinidia endosymbiont of Glossina brevipalpis]|uniref:Ribonuclease H n=1 Tax=Wigglesworthia glossinidia brevipalpis TaxID=36870 RepID=RNH_WIGBR|nr:RecName: Full=Ribonuclease H; Short=RNase H [Wigglesworthia glossinidia endosymbiont of Glossina brevipalpis]BAC24214.1 rnhA [Wigglesworthia glossinidia endosymbiont of Glossina brevipalpis]
MKKKIKIFIDGACLGNPGPGGYGVIICGKKLYKEISNGYYLTTNNRMEIMAAIIALESLHDMYNIIINTDSKYLKNGITKWIKVWKNNKWKTNNNKSVKNIDLWIKLEYLSKKHFINWNWIKGHTNNIKHDRCDFLAKISAKNPNAIDKIYQKIKNF